MSDPQISSFKQWNVWFLPSPCCWVKKNPTFYFYFFTPQKQLTVYRLQKVLINQIGESPWTGCLVLLSEFSTNDLFHPPTIMPRHGEWSHQISSCLMGFIQAPLYVIAFSRCFEICGYLPAPDQQYLTGTAVCSSSHMLSLSFFLFWAADSSSSSATFLIIAKRP